MAGPPPNAYKQGTKLTVGSHKVSIIKYISEGGFAHVYVCEVEPPFNGSKIACLKRVVVPSKWQLTLLRQEVDAMRRLRGNYRIVSYIDSHASRLQPSPGQPMGDSQQYEVFLLMEYCENNGLIDFMNTRLVNKLTESEILNIMYDVTIGVAMCHHLQPPLIHRDIKIENVLIDSKGTYKLCDFGSAVPYIPVPRTPQEMKSVHEDIMQNTTPQYRAPEMIDLTRGFPIDNKLDIWALGCFLYKLCYYTTPFELSNQNSLHDLERSILHCSETLKFKDQPGSMFSPRLKHVIECCLREDPRRRPNAVQLLAEICAMRGDVSIPNVIPYTVREEQATHFTKTKSNEEKKPSLPARKTNNIESNIELTTGGSHKFVDPFSNIDKSKILVSKSTTKLTDKGNPRPKSTYNNLHMNKANHLRPTSAYFDEKTPSIYINKTPNSTASLKELIQKQINLSSEDISLRKDNDFREKGTLDFLRGKEEESRGSHGSHAHLRQNTGGSIKASLRHGLRRISTGNSVSSIGSNQSTGNKNSHKRSSITSIKRLLSGNSFRKHSGNIEDLNIEQSAEKNNSSHDVPAKKLSIQRRMQLLLDKEKEAVPKMAHGYGKYTEENAVDDIEAINNGESGIKMKKLRDVQKHKFKPPEVPRSLKSPNKELSSNTTRTNGPPSKHSDVPLSNLKNPPPKPKKPSHLKSPEKSHHARSLSIASDISIPDVDDLEKQFSKRFPSYV